MKKITHLLIVMAIASTVACTNMSRENKDTLGGAGIGAVAGAGIASLTGGNAWTGAAAGAVAGGVIGRIHGKKESN